MSTSPGSLSPSGGGGRKLKGFKPRSFSNLALIKGQGKKVREPLQLPWIVPGLSIETELMVQRQVDFLAEDEFNFRLKPSGHHVDDLLKDFVMDWKHFKAHLADALLSRDPQLLHMKTTLVPAFISKKAFWTNWCARVHIIKVSFASAFANVGPPPAHSSEPVIAHSSSSSSLSSSSGSLNHSAPSIYSSDENTQPSPRKMETRRGTLTQAVEEIYSSDEDGFDWNAETEEMSDLEVGELTEEFYLESALRPLFQPQSGRKPNLSPREAPTAAPSGSRLEGGSRRTKISHRLDLSVLPPPPKPPLPPLPGSDMPERSRSLDSLAAMCSSTSSFEGNPSQTLPLPVLEEGAEPAFIGSGAAPDFQVNRLSIRTPLKLVPLDSLPISEPDTDSTHVPLSPRIPDSTSSIPIADSSSPDCPVFSPFVRRSSAKKIHDVIDQATVERPEVPEPPAST